MAEEEGLKEIAWSEVHKSEMYERGKSILLVNSLAHADSIPKVRSPRTNFQNTPLFRPKIA